MSIEGGILHEPESNAGRTVALHDLIRGSTEAYLLYMASRPNEVLPHPDAVYRELIVPVMLYAKAFGVTIKGSTLRQAAEMPMDTMTKIAARGETFPLNRFLQFGAWPLMLEDINALESHQRELLMGLLATNDIDGIVTDNLSNGIFGKLFSSNFQADRFFGGLHEGLAPLLTAMLTEQTEFRGDARRAYARVEHLARSTKKHGHVAVPRNNNHIVYVQPPADSSFTYIAISGREVNIPPFSRARLSRLVNLEYADLIIYTKEQIIPRGKAQVRVATIGFGYDMRMTTNSSSLDFDETQLMPIFSMDFSQRLSEALEPYNARTATTYDQQEAEIAISFPNLRFPSRSEIVRGLFLDDPRLIMQDQEFLPNVSLVISPESMRAFGKPVNLSSDWQDKPLPEKMEGATRAIWEAVEAEIYDSSKTSYLSAEAVNTIREEIARVGIHAWDTDIPQYKREFWQRSLLRAAIANPHKFMLYAQQTGLWEVLRRNYQNSIPPAEIVLQKLQEKLSAQEYAEQLTNREKRVTKEYLGWALLDEACNLSQVYPDEPNFVARILQFTLL